LEEIRSQERLCEGVIAVPVGDEPLSIRLNSLLQRPMPLY